MSLLKVDGVTKRFGGVTALDNVSLTVDSGEVVGVMGANGAGKTTLFAVIAGHLRPDAGAVQLRGRSIAGMPPHDICGLGLTRTFQIVRPFAGLTVHENALVAAFYGFKGGRSRKVAERMAHDAVEIVGLAERRHQLGGALTLSGQKRLEVARALATGADFLMLDEVMAGLTPTEVEEVLTMILRLRDEHGLTFLIIEHVMKALMRLSNRIVVLHHGKQIAVGAPDLIACDQHVLDVYYGGAA
jgi:branched-chain amino acid transport system ATP-binding protein